MRLLCTVRSLAEKNKISPKSGYEQRLRLEIRDKPWKTDVGQSTFVEVSIAGVRISVEFSLVFVVAGARRWYQRFRTKDR